MPKMKFKAWDKIRKCWIDDADLIMESSGRVWAGDINNPPMVEVETKYVKLFSGLTDSEGNEVYEGHILKPVVEGTILGGKLFRGFGGYSKEYTLTDIRDVNISLRRDIKEMKIVGHIFDVT